jgi:hypothetical protein
VISGRAEPAQQRYACRTVNDHNETEQKLSAIRKASAGDLTVPVYAHSIVEDALRFGATTEQVREAADKNPYWPFDE